MQFDDELGEYNGGIAWRVANGVSPLVTPPSRVAPPLDQPPHVAPRPCPPQVQHAWEIGDEAGAGDDGMPAPPAPELDTVRRYRACC